MEPIITGILFALLGTLLAIKAIKARFNAKLSETSGNYLTKSWLRKLKRGLLLLSLFGIAFSVFFQVSTSGFEKLPRDVSFFIDASRSMDSAGWNGDSRFENAKSFITKAVSGRPNNRYSLYAFSDRSKNVIPPTRDSEAFLLLLSGFSPKSVPSPSTDLNSAFASIQLSSESKKSTSMVILTDGGDKEDTPTTEQLRNSLPVIENGSVSAVLFGTNDSVPIPIGTDFFGNETYLTRGDERILTSANRLAAERIAEVGNGKFSMGDVDPVRFIDTVVKNSPPIADGANLGSFAEDRKVSGILLFVLGMLFALSFSIPDKFLKKNA